MLHDLFSLLLVRNSQDMMNKLEPETICIHVNEGQIFTSIPHPNSVGNSR